MTPWLTSHHDAVRHKHNKISLLDKTTRGSGGQSETKLPASTTGSSRNAEATSSNVASTPFPERVESLAKPQVPAPPGCRKQRRRPKKIPFEDEVAELAGA